MGVTTAFELARAGHEVTVVERQSQAAAECSYANGGQLSYSHAEPWANPTMLKKIPAWLIKRNSPLTLHPSFDPMLWRWSLSFLRHCTPGKVLSTSEQLLTLALYSKQSLQKIMRFKKIVFDHEKIGTLHIFSDKKALRRAVEHAKHQAAMGCRYTLLEDRDACVEKEPALAFTKKYITGGLFFPEDESGDVHQFASALAEYATEKYGVKFLYHTNVIDITKRSHTILGIQTDKGHMQADAYVVAMGAYSPLLLKRIGISVPIYPMKGYSLSVAVNDDEESTAPKIPMTDLDSKLVTSRLGNMLRIAGTAEFSGYNHHICQQRIKVLKDMAQHLFPTCTGIAKAREWTCLRPSTPDGFPIIGRTKYGNLFVNTGHGSLGWTLSCGSARVLTDIIDGKPPEINIDEKLRRR